VPFPGIDTLFLGLPVCSLVNGDDEYDDDDVEYNNNIIIYLISNSCSP
jgi:hypothetical protein